MKKNIAIIVLVILANLLALNSVAQHTKSSTITRLGDETTISIKGDTATIECENEAIYNILMHKFIWLFTNQIVSRKTDHKHTFVRAFFYLNRHDADIIKSWAKSNL